MSDELAIQQLRAVNIPVVAAKDQGYLFAPTPTTDPNIEDNILGVRANPVCQATATLRHPETHIHSG